MAFDSFAEFRGHVERRPDRVALQIIADAGRESYTYGQVAREVRTISLFLQRSGIRPGDAVALLVENHPRWGIAFWAAQSAGAVIVPLDILHNAETLAGLIRHAECKMAIVSGRLVPLWKEVGAYLPAVLPALLTGPSEEGITGWDDVLDEADEVVSIPLCPREIDDDLLILYTSGTTGNPKGVVLTNRAVYRNSVEVLRVIGLSPEDHVLSVLPLYHVLALMTNFIIPLFVGGRVTYLPVLEAHRILAAFREEGITVFICVPQFFYLLHRRVIVEVEKQGAFKRALFRALLKFSRFANLHLGWNPGTRLFPAIHRPFGARLRLLGVGGARFDPRVAADFRDLGFHLAQAYGLSETAALVTVAPPVGHAVGSAGRPLAHTEVRIDSPDDSGTGEVVIRGENLMRGYWKNPQATAEVMQDGWFLTGDLGYLDSRGYLHITGRKKDVIVLSSGKNIYPEEVEYFYQSNCPLIKEICVLGRRDPSSDRGEEQLHAVIVPDLDYLRNRQIVNTHDAVRWHVETLSPKLPPYKRVRSMEIRLEPLPRTTTRKLKRFQLEKEIAGRAERKSEPRSAGVTEPETPLEQAVLNLIRRLKPEAPFGRELNLELDLGITSLERVELLYSIREMFDITIPDEEGAKIFTVADLVVAIESRLRGAENGGTEPRTSWSEMLRRPLDAEEARRVRRIFAPRPVLDRVYFVLTRFLRLLFLPTLRLRFAGREQLPKDGACLICPNHVSYLDAFLLISGLPYRVLTRTFILGESDYFRHPIARLGGYLARVVPVSAERGPGESLRLAAEGLRKGMVLCIFPEGERSIDGALKSFRMGPSVLATALSVPAVPAGIHGAWDVWSRGSSRIRLRPVSIRFGPPLAPTAGEAPAFFNQRLFQAVADIIARSTLRVP